MNYLSYIKDFLWILPLIIITIFFHSVIFNVNNHIFIIPILLFIILLDKKIRFNYLQIINLPVFIFSAFVLYAYLRFDFNFVPGFKDDGNSIASQEIHLINMLIFLSIFVLSIIIGSSDRKMPRFISMYALIYCLMFITASLLSRSVSHNLGVGVILITMFPFIIIGLDEKDAYKSIKINIVALVILLTLFIIGNRAASVAFLIFILLYNSWPYFFRNKFTYYFIFFGTLSFLGLFFYLYLNSLDFIFSHAYERSQFTSAGTEFFAKALDTRYDIWHHLSIIINNEINIFYGAGSNLWTGYISPLEEYEFNMNRFNLSAHNLYLEIVYRIGIIGLILFILFFLSIWMGMWSLNQGEEIRIFGPILIAYLWILNFQVFIFFGYEELRSGFFFIFLGLIVGKYIFYKKNLKIIL